MIVNNNSGEILKIIKEAIEEFNELQESDENRLIFHAETILFGRGGKLKSVDLVRLIVEIEFKLGEHFGIVNVLTSEKAMSRQNSPFKTIGTLTEYICSLEPGQ